MLASELVAREDGPLARLELVDVTDADTLDPDEFGELAYGVVVRAGGDGGHPPTRLADVYAHADRARVEFRVGLDAFPEAAHDADLRVRPKAVDPPRVLVFVEDGGEVKRAVRTVTAAIAASGADRRDASGDDSTDA
nr:hypothetical protein [Halomarina oriensis]